MIRENDGRETQPAEYVKCGGVISFSNLEQLEILRGMEERGMSFRTAVRGYSMHPFIQDNDVITISPLREHPPRVGEVVAFTFPDIEKLAIHRVIGKNKAGLLLKGDNCQKPDGVIDPGQVIGRITSIERGGRRIQLGLKLATGSYLIALLSAHKLLGVLIKTVSAALKIVRVKR